jgi:hypothetical protein
MMVEELIFANCLGLVGLRWRLVRLNFAPKADIYMIPVHGKRASRVLCVCRSSHGAMIIWNIILPGGWSWA